MFLRHLEIVNYKNHENQVFDFEAKFNVFVGKNGIGKTNILDAIYYLANFRSHISSADSLNISYTKDFFRILGILDDNHQVLVKYAPRNKSIEINQVRVQKYSEAFGHLPIVLASPADIFLLHDGSEERRKFIDYTISNFHKEYLHNLNRYQHFLDQRNALLKHNEKLDLGLIKYYNTHLSELGQAIFQVRREAIEEIRKEVLHWYRAIANQDDALNLSYSSQLLESDLTDLLENTLQKDMILKRTTAGIHRDDLTLSMNDLDLKKTASQGQQKSLLYALRIAQAAFLARKLNKKPIFLIDDFSDKLDTDRQNHLIGIMSVIDFVEQWFISDTHDLQNILSTDTQIFQLS